MNMQPQPDNTSRIHRAVARARRRWLLSMTVNAGGRWAVLPGGLAALLGIALALAGWAWLSLLIVAAALGVAGMALVLGLTWWACSRPGARGAPDWTLLLDRALGLDDALPTLLERGGEFTPVIEARVANGLDRKREKLATPARHWGALIVALVLALMPLVFWRPDPGDQANPPGQIAEEDARPEDSAAPRGNGGEGQGGGTEPGEDGGGEDGDENEGGSGTGDGEEGKVRSKPDGNSGDGSGRPPPEGELPKPENNSPRPEGESGVGEHDQPPTPPPEREDPDLDTNLEHIKPDAGEGETRAENRSRWVYDPDGDKLDESRPSPPDIEHPGEKSVPRTKLTSKERKAIEELFKKLYE